jgi:hypothetical protein
MDSIYIGYSHYSRIDALICLMPLSLLQIRHWKGLAGSKFLETQAKPVGWASNDEYLTFY